MMKRTLWIVFSGLILLTACQSTKTASDNWIQESVDQWPSFLLTNQIEIGEQIYTDFAAGFLVAVEGDTFAVTSKQLFIAFSGEGLMTVDFKGKLKSWIMHPPGHPEKKVIIDQLLNSDSTEFSALPNATNNKDWLVFSIHEMDQDLPVLKIAKEGAVKGVAVKSMYYESLGEAKNYQAKPFTASVIQLFDNQLFLLASEVVTNPVWLTGAPVLNEKGEVVAIITLLNQKIGQACSANYFLEVIKLKT